jgi:hypothetical protein
MSSTGATGADTVLKPHGLGKTSRHDAWWFGPGMTLLVLSTFIVYATWAAFQGKNYWVGAHYLSPFYSPEVWGNSPHAFLGPKPGWWPGWLPFSPALLILPFPAFFRFSCYYYRGAYYKAFWADPPACAVSEPRKKYNSENGWPLKIQNIHRYVLFFAIFLLAALWRDVFDAFFHLPTANGGTGFGIAVGSLVILGNTILLSFYTFSCHTFRYLIGGRRKRLSDRPAQLACYNCVSGLNKKHMYFAWCSLFSVMLADLYVRLVASGVLHDVRIL